MSQTPIRRFAISASIVCLVAYMISLGLPALYFERESGTGQGNEYWGIAVLLLGWIEAMNFSLNGIAWYANPCFAFGSLLLILGRYRLAVPMQAVASVFASTAFGVSSVCVNEAGQYASVTALGSGFWVWYATILTSFVASAVLCSKSYRAVPVAVVTVRESI